MNKEEILAKAIFDAAVKAGGCCADAQPNGPELLLLLNDMADRILELENEVRDCELELDGLKEDYDRAMNALNLM